ncbi:hypothetical protein OBV_35850 [Oscillibacter valericigenes Sjm18-20]|nr:hypothetical protein OBV_35850 [Oscillibacter valericigenes Sjm18-20]
MDFTKNGQGGKTMPLNRQNQEKHGELPQEPSPVSKPETGALDDPHALAAIIKGLLNGRLE